MITIDNTEVKSVTIDGVDVKSITMDGVTVWQKLVNAGILRSIEVGDDLTGKTLYFGFPDGLYSSIPSFARIIDGNATNTLNIWWSGTSNPREIYVGKQVYIEGMGLTSTSNTTAYSYTTSLQTNILSVSLNDSFYSGISMIVTRVDKTQEAYQYIKIIDDGLRNLEVGDVINRKTLYLSIPNDSYLFDSTTANDVNVISTASGSIYSSKPISSYYYAYFDSGMNYDMLEGATVASQTSQFFNYDDSTGTVGSNNKWIIPLINVSTDVTVTAVDITSPLYPFIKIRKAPWFKNIEVGDNLSGVTLYSACSDNLWKELVDFDNSGTSKTFILTNNNMDVVSVCGMSDAVMYKVSSDNQYMSLYDYDSSTVSKVDSVILASYFGVVSSIDNTNPAYKYIFAKMRNIEEDDLLTGTKLYLKFPTNFYYSLKAINTINSEAMNTPVYDDLGDFMIEEDYSQTQNNNIVAWRNPNTGSYTNIYTPASNPTSITLANDVGLIANNIIPATLSHQFMNIIDTPKLRHINIGDDLSNKTLFFNFPGDFDTVLNNYTHGNPSIIASADISTNGYIWCQSSFGNGYGFVGNMVAFANSVKFWEISSGTVSTNLSYYTLPSNWSVVSTIDAANPAYQYIWILDI